MKDIVRDAFVAVRNREQSPDAVIADSILNARFLAECRTRGLTHAALELNRCLQTLRKNKELQGIRSRRTVVKDQGEFRFASEIAVRFLERKHQVSLDHILCDPALAIELDDIASQIAPGFSSFEYRWAALGLRKRKRLRPELLARVLPPEAVVTLKASEIELQRLPPRPALYMFFQAAAALYIGECQNLRKRIGKHMDHSDNKGLAHWMWERGDEELHLEYQVLAPDVTTRQRKALETEMIASRKSLFNVAARGP